MDGRLPAQPNLPLIVVVIRTADVRGIHPAVAQVGAGNGVGDNGVGLVAVDSEVVDARHGDGLWRVPVTRGERHGRWQHCTFGEIAAAQVEGHVRRRLCQQHDGEGGRATGFRCHQTARRRDADSRAVVVDVCHRNVGRIQPVVVAIAAGRGSRHDGVGLVAVGQRVISARHSDKLRRAPIERRERQ